MAIDRKRFVSILNYRCFITLSLLVLGLSLFSCSSEKSQQPETGQQSGSGTEVANQTTSGAQEASSSSPSSIQTGTGRQETPAEPKKNSLPKIDSARLQIEGSKIKVIAKGSDKDGGPVTFTYEWEKNGQPAGSGETISGFKRGDVLSVMITPYNGKEYGKPRVITSEVKNTPPTITEHSEAKFDGKVWSYQVKAVDPDGDPLTYSLKSAPQGMTINGTTGLIQWEVPPKFAGKAPVTVSVTDGQGGESFQEFAVDVKAEQKGRNP